MRGRKIVPGKISRKSSSEKKNRDRFFELPQGLEFTSGVRGKTKQVTSLFPICLAFCRPGKQIRLPCFKNIGFLIKNILNLQQYLSSMFSNELLAIAFKKEVHLASFKFKLCFGFVFELQNSLESF